MKKRKIIFATVLTLILAFGIVTGSALAASASGKNPDKTAAKPDAIVTDAPGDCAGQPLEGFVKELGFLTEREKEALLADLAEIESLEARMDELYARMTDENADRLYDEIDALHERLGSVLEKNAELWDRVDAEYDERTAAYEPDTPFELNENDFAICKKGR